jgi:asparagine synthase (glutamine-hydrolysing)
MGFSIPLSAWLREELRCTGEDLLLSDRALARGYFNADRVRDLWRQHQQGRREYPHQIWALMVLELWHRLFVDQTTSSPPDPGTP